MNVKKMTILFALWAEQNMNARKMTILFALWAVVALSYCWFYNELMELLTPFLMIVPFLLLLLWSVAFLVWGIIFLMKGRRTDGVKAVIPIMLFTVVACLCLFLPFEMLKTKLEYGLYYDKRMRIVSSIQHNELADDGIGNISLPTGFRQLSVDGEAYVYQQNNAGTIVGFWVRRGLTSDSSSAIYSSQDIPPTAEALGSEQIYQIHQLGDHWYYIDAE